MKSRTLLPIVTALAVSVASAQTQVGQVTLTPVQTAPRTNGGVKPRPVQAPTQTQQSASAPRTVQNTAAPAAKPAATTTTVTAAKTFTPQDVPEGSYNLTGKVMGMATRLPAGSKIVLMVQDEQAPGTPLLQIKFGASALPVPYQMYFTQSRLKANHNYFVQAKVFDAAGQLTHLSTPVALPTMSSTSLNLTVQAAR